MSARRAAAGVMVVLLAAALIAWRTCGAPARMTEPAAVGAGSALRARPLATDARDARDLAALRWALPDPRDHRRIAGIVYVDDVPARATVTLVSRASLAQLVDAPTRSTGADGVFDFGEVAARNVTLVARAGERVRLVELAGLAAVDHLAVYLYTCDPIVGRVVDAGGGPIVGAKLADARSRVPLGETGAHGEFALCEPPLQAVLRVTADGYAAHTTGITQTSPIVIILRPETTITGTVVDARGTPIAGAEVFEGARTLHSTLAFTDDHGRFTLDALAPGHHVLGARRDGLTSCAPTSPTLVDTTVGGAIADITIVLVPGTVLAGTIHRGAQPAANLELTWTAPATPPLRVRTDADGNFREPGACAGSGHLEVGVETIETPAFGNYTLAADSAPVSIELRATIALAVRVVGADGTPAADVIVIAACAHDQYSPSAPLTDAAGRVELHVAAATECRIDAAHVDDGRRGASATFATDTAPAELVVTLGPRGYGSVIATVTDASGAPAPHVTIVLVDGSGAEATRAHSDDAGHALLQHVAPGTYTIAAQSAALMATPLAAVVTPATVTVADGTASYAVAVQLATSRTRVAGIVVDAHGAPVADAQVVAYAIADDARGAAVQLLADQLPDVLAAAATVTGIDGRFAMQLADPAPYEVHAAAGAQRGMARVDASAAAANVRVVTSLPSQPAPAPP